jgi:hypothetical protein
LTQVKKEKDFRVLRRAQRIADKMPALPRVNILHAFARRVTPLLEAILSGMEFCRVIDQAEYAADVMCGNTAWNEFDEMPFSEL